MSITVNLWSRKSGEIKRFLECYYEKALDMDSELKAWECEYDKPLESVDIISAVMDNTDIFQINVLIQVNKGQYHIITNDNHNEVIKDIFKLFYNENTMLYN